MRKKTASRARMARADALAETLTKLGYEPTLVDETCVIARGPVVHARCDFDADTMHFARADRFDRWANSRDFVFEGIHEDDEGLAIVLRIAEDCARNGIERDDSFEPVPLNQWWRRYKREARLEGTENEPAEIGSGPGMG